MTGAEKLLLAALALQLGLTFWLALGLSVLRVRGVRSGAVRIAEIAVDSGNWPLKPKLYANAFANQFQLPLLFYVATLLALSRGAADPTLAALAFGFVALRIVHAGIHVTDNSVPRRFVVYAIGYAVLVLMWIYLLARLLLG